MQINYMENKKNTNLLIGLGVVLIIVAVFWLMNKSSVTVVEENAEQSLESTEDTSEGSVNANVPAVSSLNYTQALEKYKNARIELDPSCQARPNVVTYKNNTSVMIDNRSNVARTVKVGSTFPLKAYGFKIVKISSATLPFTWYVDCDKSQNVATILIQI